MRIPDIRIRKPCSGRKLGLPSQNAIFDASLGLARQLTMESVAEGVKDRANWNFVLQRGCDMAQGYFIAELMPAADLPAWMADWEERRAQLVPH